MIRKILCITFLGFILMSCSDGIPDCVDTLLDDFKTTACVGGDLTKWDFNGREVYCFFPGTCISDAQAEIYDEDCNPVCTLFGIAGITECEGIEWNDNAVFLELVYVHQ